MMMMSESVTVEDLSLKGWKELDSLWWNCLVPLTSLRNLGLENCPEVVSIGATKKEEKAELQQLDIPCNIEYLRIIDCKGLENLSKTVHSNLTCLREIYIVKCPKLVSLAADSLPSTLKSLKIEECENLVCLLEDGEDINFSTTSLLQSLDVYKCKALKSLSSSGKLPIQLKTLWIRGCQELESVAKGIGDNTCLESIQIGYCENLVCFPESGLPTTNLKSLWIDDCEKLEALPKLYSLLQLQELRISNCPRVTSIPEEGLPTNLTEIEIRECESLEALPNLYSLLQLKKLLIRDCPRVTSIPERGLPTNIQRLFIYEPNLCKVVRDCIDSPLLKCYVLMAVNVSKWCHFRKE
ncbi:hypothetical protein PTKIN_Ptkin16aG0014000 [Pterospermum kingtungense]